MGVESCDVGHLVVFIFHTKNEHYVLEIQNVFEIFSSGYDFISPNIFQ